MNANFPAKTYLLGLIITLFITSFTYAQVGINTITPADGSMLDVTSTEKGMLVPRVDIDNLSTIDPITGGSTESLLVYNTNATTGTGFYFWNGTRWVGLDGEKDWKLLGNSGTNESVNFLGTTDGEALTFRTDDTERFRIANGDQVQAMGDGSIIAPFYSWEADPTMGFYKSGVKQMSMSINGDQFFNANSNEPTVEWTFNPGGDDINLRVETDGDANTLFVDGLNDNIGVGTNTPATDVKLEVNGGANNAIFGYSDNVGGYLGRETNITIGLPGNTQTISGAGVYANNPLAGYTSVFSQSTGAATVAANVNYSDVWIANYNYVDNSNAGYNPPGAYVQLNKNESSTGGQHIALKALSTREASGNPGYTIGILTASIAGPLSGTQTEDTYGIISQATNTASEYAIGGEFIGMGGSGGYVVDIADDYNNRKIIGTGSVSEVIPTENHGRIILTAPESPEYWYQDYGSVQMNNGVAIIQIDPILSDVIVVDSQNPVRVICTPYQMPYFNGVTVMKYDKNTVEIRELNGGTHSGTLQYQLVVKPKTNYGEGRFPQANAPYFAKGLELPKAKTSNQHNRNNVFEWPADWEVYGYETVAKQYLSGKILIETMDNKDKK